MKNVLLAAAAAISIASPAGAAIIIEVGPGAIQPDENVLFINNPAPGFTIEGITNQTNTLLSITGGETLRGEGGQARLDATDGTLSTTFTFNSFADQLVGFDLANAGLAFTETEFRLFRGTATEATLTFVDTAGEVFQQTFDIPSNGFFSARAIDGQLIDYFSIAVNGTVGDVRQVRIGGVQPTGVIPEPGAWALMILGFGGAGAALRQQRRRALA